MSRALRFALAALFVAGLARALQGLAALAIVPDVLATQAPGGIWRWIPHGLSVVFGVVACWCWSRRLAVRTLAAAYALAAGAFARPAVLAAGWPDVRVEAALVPLAVVCLALALERYARPLRLALAAVPAVLATEILILSLPPRPALDAGALAAILAAALIGGAAAHDDRRDSLC